MSILKNKKVLCIWIFIIAVIGIVSSVYIFNSKLDYKVQTSQEASNDTREEITYKSDKLGIELTFPYKWKNKYEIIDTRAGILIAYIFQHDYYYDYEGKRQQRGEYNTRYLFSIEATSLLDGDELSTIDGIPGVTKFKTIHGNEYVIGGPTDCLESDDPDWKEVEEFLKDIPSIVNSIKEF